MIRFHIWALHDSFIFTWLFLTHDSFMFTGFIYFGTLIFHMIYVHVIFTRFIPFHMILWDMIHLFWHDSSFTWSSLTSDHGILLSWCQSFTWFLFTFEFYMSQFCSHEFFFFLANDSFTFRWFIYFDMLIFHNLFMFTWFFFFTHDSFIFHDSLRFDSFHFSLILFTNNLLMCTQLVYFDVTFTRLISFHISLYDSFTFLFIYSDVFQIHLHSQVIFTPESCSFIFTIHFIFISFFTRFISFCMWFLKKYIFTYFHVDFTWFVYLRVIYFHFLFDFLSRDPTLKKRLVVYA